MLQSHGYSDSLVGYKSKLIDQWKEQKTHIYTPHCHSHFNFLQRHQNIYSREKMAFSKNNAGQTGNLSI